MQTFKENFHYKKQSIHIKDISLKVSQNGIFSQLERLTNILIIDLNTQYFTWGYHMLGHVNCFADWEWNGCYCYWNGLRSLRSDETWNASRVQTRQGRLSKKMKVDLRRGDVCPLQNSYQLFRVCLINHYFLRYSVLVRL